MRPDDDVRDIFERVDAQPSAQFSEALLARVQAEHLRVRLDVTREAEVPALEPIVMDVLREEPRTDRGRRAERPTRRRSRRRTVVAATAAAVVIVATLLVRDATGDDVEVQPGHPDPVTTTNPPPDPSLLPDGLTGLPPEGATPSTPETGRLLARLPIPLWVYEDGRIISARHPDYEHWTGFLEQRLTPEGVELVRAEILALEPVEDCMTSGGYYGYHDGGRFVCTSPGPATNLYIADPQYERVSELQFGAHSWLPASAWADPEPKPYVPSTYEFEISPADDVPTMLEDLPSEVAELLTRSTECGNARLVERGLTFHGAPSVCFEVSTEEARQVAATLGIAQLESGQTYPVGTYTVSLLPYLPHGAAVWCCGG